MKPQTKSETAGFCSIGLHNGIVLKGAIKEYDELSTKLLEFTPRQRDAFVSLEGIYGEALVLQLCAIDFVAEVKPEIIREQEHDLEIVRIYGGSPRDEPI